MIELNLFSFWNCKLKFKYFSAWFKLFFFKLSAIKSRLYDSELILTSGQQSGLSFKISHGDYNHNVIKLQEPRLQMYRDELDDDGNFDLFYRMLRSINSYL